MSHNKSKMKFVSTNKNNIISSTTNDTNFHCPEQIPKCDDCGYNKNNTIYVTGFGYITYCSASCFRNSQ